MEMLAQFLADETVSTIVVVAPADGAGAAAQAGRVPADREEVG